MSELEGVFIPVPTPFRGEELAVDRLKANLARWNQTPLSGYVILGSTGEFPLVTEQERDQILVAAREAVPKEKLCIAGTGADSTRETIRRTKRAAEIGADAAIVITPHYFKKGFSQPAAQIRHYLAVAETSPIPVVLYNFPQNTGINLEPETVARIAEHPNVRGIKDSSGNIPQAGQIIHQTPKSFYVLVGSSGALLPSLAVGSSGGIIALANIAAREHCEVYALARQGRWAEAREIANRLLPVDRGVHGRYGIGGVKAALDLQGFYGGPCRSPLATPDGDAIEEIKELLAVAGLME
jgi:4-hydroxy-2-oxoglutarate aldolase